MWKLAGTCCPTVFFNLLVFYSMMPLTLFCFIASLFFIVFYVFLVLGSISILFGTLDLTEIPGRKECRLTRGVHDKAKSQKISEV